MPVSQREKEKRASISFLKKTVDKKKITYVVVGVVIFVLLQVLLVQRSSNRVVTSVDKSSVTTVRLAVIDSVRLKAEALCFRAHEKLEAKLSDLIIEMRTSEEKAKKDYGTIKNNKILSKKEVLTKLEQVENEWNKISQKYKKEVENIRTMDIKLSDIIQKKLNNIITRIAQKYKIDIILNSQIRDTISVFYANKNVDITNVVIKTMNKAISDIDLEKLKQW